VPLNAEAKFLSNDFLAPGLLEESPNRLQFLTVLPFYPIHGDTLTYVTTPELEFATPIGFCDAIPEHTKLPQEPRKFPMVELATHFEVSYKAQDVFCQTNDQYEVQRGLAIRQLLYRFGELFEVGDSVADANVFDGLRKLVAPGQTIDLACTPLTIEVLDRAKGLVRANNGYAGVIITNQLGLEQIRKVHYDVGVKPDTEVIAVPDPAGGTRMQQVTKFDGWIIYVNDKQPNGECPTLPEPTPSTNIGFAQLGWNHLHGTVPDCVGDSMFVHRRTIRPENSKDVGHVTWPVGLALGTPSALAGIINAIKS
jgi:hypothetical protein